jgi:hypothetical protein
MPFPKVFTLLDLQTKAYFAGKRTERIASDLPSGGVAFGDRWVRSMPIAVPGHERLLFIAGRIDTALAFDDGTFGIVDFKTTVPKAEHAMLYGRQLHAYALAAEHPAPANLGLRPVTRLGLVCFEPEKMSARGSSVAYKGRAHWIEIPRDDRGFMRFLGQVAELLDRSSPPEPSPNCSFCAYLSEGALAILNNWLSSVEAEARNGEERGPAQPGKPHLAPVERIGERIR